MRPSAQKITGAAIVIAAALALVNRWARTRSDTEPTTSGVLNPAGVRDLYDRVAPYYDLAALPYRWTGAQRLIRQAVDELTLQPGDRVVDLGTGTGRNLPALAKAVGDSGQVIGVDISPEMLSRARQRVAEHDLGNVTLVEADIGTYMPPPETRAAISTFAIEMLPNYNQVIANLASVLGPGGRIATVGLRHPDRWPEWLVRLGSAANRPFGVADDYRTHRPWEAIQRYTTDTIYRETLGGAIYLAAGTTGPSIKRPE